VDYKVGQQLYGHFIFGGFLVCIIDSYIVGGPDGIAVYVIYG